VGGEIQIRDHKQPTISGLLVIPDLYLSTAGLQGRRASGLRARVIRFTLFSSVARSLS